MTQDVMQTGKDSGREFAKCPRIIQKCGMFIFLDGKGSSSISNNDNNYSSTKSTNYPSKPRATGSIAKKQKCFKCNKTGHWANACPN